MTSKFLRRTRNRYSKLGKKRKNKLVWRKPTGRHNSMREKRRGYSAVVSIGYRTEKKLRGMVENKKPVLISSADDLKKLKKGEIAIISHIGKKKKIEIAKKAQELNIKIYNLNLKRFLKTAEKKIEKQESKEIIKNKKEESKK